MINLPPPNGAPGLGRVRSKNKLRRTQRNRGCEDILINLNEVYWTSFRLRIARESLQDADSYKLAELRGEEQGIV